ncbi:hypothetical protein EDD37DRAFT_471576 [Exophiala viscosa]|uniref:DUF3752 domain-containing protein n=1 Tax=Exophiala viscosa TaxID=2486360 RepID=A0AAN6IEE9_9EURO|nr:hypothetical protein EDD36DRAFT_214517 [Exophiala viscosa]KAI1622392.1 hypothetical protein EDD37DRAFT_471576 [Exophiala viscosa]
MSSVGPELPPELQKRRRSAEDDDEENNSSDSSTGPLPSRTDTQAQAPPSTKRARVIGPSLPPAPLDQRPSSPPQADRDENTSESSDQDDDYFGPSLPSAADAIKPTLNGPQAPEVSTRAPAPAQRDEWMTLAPTSGDWSSRVDPTKLKNRGFNTGRGSKAPPKPPSGGDQSWHETPEQKQARLKREVMGIKDSTVTTTGSKTEHNAHDEETARRLKEYNEKQRGTSLYASHHASSRPIEEDDPSARAFDREKDIAGGATVNSTKRREMLKKAADFSSRFSSAKYL